jgi:hypothetical protein
MQTEIAQYSKLLRTGRSGDLMSVKATFSAPVQSCPRVYTNSCAVGNCFLSREYGGRDVVLITHPT